MPTQEKISDFLFALIEDEHLCYKKNDVDATTKFVYLKFKEVYWMITRWLGVARLRDRTRKRRWSAPARPELTDDQLSSPARWDDVSPRVPDRRHAYLPLRRQHRDTTRRSRNRRQSV